MSTETESHEFIGWYDGFHERDAEIERLRKAIHEAFMAMCAQRDSPDEEVFQDAIDALGLAVSNGER